MPTAPTRSRIRYPLGLLIAASIALLWLGWEGLPDLFGQLTVTPQNRPETTARTEPGDRPGPSVAVEGHAILGSWEYDIYGSRWQREYSRDRKCTLRRENGSVAWIYDFRVIDPKTVEVFLERKGVWRPQKLLEDGRLDVGEGMIAERVSLPH